MIVISSTQTAYATTSVGGWTATDIIMSGATTTINAIKGGGSSAVSSFVKVAPSAVKIGKHLIKGGGSAALLLAVPQLIGEGVSWVLDPANNAVKYTVSNDDPSIPWATFVFKGSDAKAYSTGKAASEARIRELVIDVPQRNYVYKSDNCPSSPVREGNCIVTYTATHNDNKPFDVYVTIVANPNYDSGSGAVIDKYLPIDQVAAQVISNASSGESSSQDAVKAAALEGFSAGEYDSALEAAIGTEAPPDTAEPTDPAVPADPAVPFDPSSILAAISGLAAMLAAIFGSMSDFFDWWTDQWETFATSFTELKDWATTEPAPLEPEPVTVIDDVDIGGWQEKAEAGYVQFGGQCPSDVEIPINYMGASTNLSISYVPFCQFASMIKPAVILGAWISAMLIISGGRARES
tara:strand:+ start:3688 stop:4911 length:1224 start_codon:yes stop_codon:yes gene_type:complete